MDLTLTAREQKLLAGVIRVFLSPLDHPTVDSWRSAANKSAGTLLAADCASFMLPDSGGAYLYSDEWPPEVSNAYPTRVAALDERFQFWRRQLAAGAWSRRQIFNSTMYRSEYYNAFIVPVRAFDAVGITIDPGAGGRLAGMLFHHNQPTGRRFGRKGMLMLHLMQPAFDAGVRAHQSLRDSRSSLAHSIDEMVTATLLMDARGRLVHANCSARRLLDAPAGMMLRAMAQEASVAELRSNSSAILEVRAPRFAEVLGTRYRLSFTFAGTELGALNASVMVTIGVDEDRPGALPISLTALVAAFRLTRQEAAVACLLIERRSNTEIATILSISPHTARHHTERVLGKIGVHSRAAVRDRVSAVMQRGGG